MAKRSKGPARKHIHMAAEARRDRTRQLYFLLLAVLGGILLWGLVSFVPGINTHTIASSIFIFGAAVIVVIVIGEVGVRFSKYNNEYNRIKNEYGISEQDVKDYIKNNK